MTFFIFLQVIIPQDSGNGQRVFQNGGVPPNPRTEFNRFKVRVVAESGEVEKIVAAVGGVTGELVFEDEGSLHDNDVERVEALEGDGGAARAVEAVHERLDACSGVAVGGVADGEDGGDGVLGGRGGEGVRGGAEDVDADGGHLAVSG